ncbi:hypothetical protein HID58_055678, partial [Brassica napus]
SRLAAGDYGNLTDLVERAVNVEVAVAAEAKNESKRKGVSGQKGKQIVQFKDSKVGHIARQCMAEQAALAEEHPPLALLEDRPPRKRRNMIKIFRKTLTFRPTGTLWQVMTPEDQTLED